MANYVCMYVYFIQFKMVANNFFFRTTIKIQIDLFKIYSRKASFK